MSHGGENASYTREAIHMFASFAAGGAGIVTLGEAGVHSLTDHAHPTMPHMDDEMTLPGLIQTVDQVHMWGALASIELTHSGCRARGDTLAPGGYVIGPSPMKANLYGDRVIEMDERMMDMIADAYAQAAYMAEFAGVDIINIHGGHGWLISQFLSDLNNHRTDRYGGSIENKARFPLMIIDRVRQRCRPHTIIEFRMSVDEVTQGGMKPEEVIEFAKLVDGKVDILHISAGTFHDTGTACRMFPTVFYPRGCNLEAASQVKAAVKRSLVTVVGGFNDPDMMDRAIADGKVDLVTVGRQFIADPNWPKKAKAGKADEIIKCIRCTQCHSASFIPHVPFSSGVLRCSVNPSWGREYENTRRELKAERVKKVLVAGGGPGGMEAALTAARRGHNVILCEKNDHLAANLDYARRIPFKRDLADYLDSMETNIRRTANIQLRLNTAVDEDLIRAECPDVMIVACGAEPIIPPIPGIDRPTVHHITDVFKRDLELGDKIVIIGGGLAGCEEGLSLAWEGKDVTIVEMKKGLAEDAPYVHWRHLLSKLNGSVHSYCSAKVLSIEQDGVTIVDIDGQERTLAADTVLIAAGMRANSEKFDSWRELAEEVIVIGDARRSSKIMDATRTGYCAGMTI